MRVCVLLHPFNSLFSRTTWVSRYQKGKTSLDLNETRDYGVLGCSGISWTICKQSAPCSRQITTPTHTHTYGPLSGTTRVSRYQKGKTNLDFTEARDSEWQWHQLGHMQVCTSRQITTPAPHHSVFYRPNALPAAQPTVSKH